MLVLAGIEGLGGKLAEAYSGTNRPVTFKGENSRFYTFSRDTFS